MRSRTTSTKSHSSQLTDFPQQTLRPQHTTQFTPRRLALLLLSLTCGIAQVYVLALGMVASTHETAEHPLNQPRTLQQPDRIGENELRELRHPDGWIETRSQMLDELGAKDCRLPNFYYKGDYEDYKLSKSGSFISQDQWRRRARDVYKEGSYREKKKYKGEDKSRKKDKSRDRKLTRSITCIHVGKAGGSSVSCSLRESRKYGVRKHCGGTNFNSRKYKESAISHQVNCYTHYNYNGHCLKKNRSFLVNVRNPIHRIKSWYLYEHFLNQPITKPVFKRKTQHCGNIMLGTCYHTFDHLATVGLSGLRPAPSQRLHVGTNLTAEECSHWAWATVTGGIPASYHNVFNYEWYVGPILEMSSEKTEIFVLRIEHLDQDWRTVDLMVGGTGETVPGDVVSSPVNVAAEKPLPMTNSTLSAVGTRNLCRAMCQEMQVYKTLLSRAVNIDEDDYQASMDELRAVCPEEPNDIQRKCP